MKRSASIVEDKPKVQAPEILPTPEVDVVRQAAQQNTIEDVKTSNATGNDDRLDGALLQANKTPALQPKDSDKVETNRLKVSSFEEFKRKKSALQTAELASELAANQANGERVDENEQDTLDSSAAELPINAGLASNHSKQTLDEFWVDFYQTQTPRVLTCLKGLKYGIEEGQLIITLNASHQDGIIEEIRTLMMQAIKKQVAHLKIQSIQTVMGKIEVQERRPYTDKEKLDYLVKKHPGLAEALESLHLRLP